MKKSSVVLGALVCCCASQALNAEMIYDGRGDFDSHAQVFDLAPSGYGETRVAQGFVTPDAPMALSSISVALRNSRPGEFPSWPVASEFLIYASTADFKPSVPLASLGSVVDAGEVVQWYELGATDPIVLSPNTHYFIVADAPNGHYIEWEGNASFVQFSHLTQTLAEDPDFFDPTWKANPFQPFSMSLVVNASVIPEPTATVVWAFGPIAALAIRRRKGN